jgi:hypothetical protein
VVAHDRVGSSTDPTLNGHFRYPNKLDQSLNDTSADKIRKYRADYHNRPPNTVSFMPGIPSTSGRLHSEFVRLLFLQSHRESDRFFTGSGVHLGKPHGITVVYYESMKQELKITPIYESRCDGRLQTKRLTRLS